MDEFDYSLFPPQCDPNDPFYEEDNVSLLPEESTVPLVVDESQICPTTNDEYVEVDSVGLSDVVASNTPALVSNEETLSFSQQDLGVSNNRLWSYLNQFNHDLTFKHAFEVWWERGFDTTSLFISNYALQDKPNAQKLSDLRHDIYNRVPYNDLRIFYDEVENVISVLATKMGIVYERPADNLIPQFELEIDFERPVQGFGPRTYYAYDLKSGQRYRVSFNDEVGFTGGYYAVNIPRTFFGKAQELDQIVGYNINPMLNAPILPDPIYRFEAEKMSMVLDNGPEAYQAQLTAVAHEALGISLGALFYGLGGAAGGRGSLSQQFVQNAQPVFPEVEITTPIRSSNPYAPGDIRIKPGVVTELPGSRPTAVPYNPYLPEETLPLAAQGASGATTSSGGGLQTTTQTTVRPVVVNGNSSVPPLPTVARYQAPRMLMPSEIEAIKAEPLAVRYPGYVAPVLEPVVPTLVLPQGVRSISSVVPPLVPPMPPFILPTAEEYHEVILPEATSGADEIAEQHNDITPMIDVVDPEAFSGDLPVKPEEGMQVAGDMRIPEYKALLEKLRRELPKLPKPSDAAIEYVEENIKPLTEARDLAFRIIYLKDQIAVKGGFEVVTGLEDGAVPGVPAVLGGGLVYNSYDTVRQLFQALALVDPEIVDAALNPDLHPDRSDVARLIEAQVLAGMRILDLGCGPDTIFARLARAMGAEVWTVDMLPPDRIGPEGSVERAFYLQMDLSNRYAAARIYEATGGNFNLVTQAHLNSDAEPVMEVPNLPRMASALLRDGGAYSGSRNAWINVRGEFVPFVPTNNLNPESSGSFSAFYYLYGMRMPVDVEWDEDGRYKASTYGSPLEKMTYWLHDDESGDYLGVITRDGRFLDVDNYPYFEYSDPIHYPEVSGTLSTDQTVNLEIAQINLASFLPNTSFRNPAQEARVTSPSDIHTGDVFFITHAKGPVSTAISNSLDGAYQNIPRVALYDPRYPVDPDVFLQTTRTFYSADGALSLVGRNSDFPFENFDRYHVAGGFNVDCVYRTVRDVVQAFEASQRESIEIILHPQLIYGPLVLESGNIDYNIYYDNLQRAPNPQAELDAYIHELVEEFGEIQLVSAPANPLDLGHLYAVTLADGRKVTVKFVREGIQAEQQKPDRDLGDYVASVEPTRQALHPHPATSNSFEAFYYSDGVRVAVEVHKDEEGKYHILNDDEPYEGLTHWLHDAGGAFLGVLTGDGRFLSEYDHPYLGYVDPIHYPAPTFDLGIDQINFSNVLPDTSFRNPFQKERVTSPSQDHTGAVFLITHADGPAATNVGSFLANDYQDVPRVALYDSRFPVHPDVFLQMTSTFYSLDGSLDFLGVNSSFPFGNFDTYHLAGGYNNDCLATTFKNIVDSFLESDKKAIDVVFHPELIFGRLMYMSGRESKNDVYYDNLQGSVDPQTELNFYVQMLTMMMKADLRLVYAPANPLDLGQVYTITLEGGKVVTVKFVKEGQNSVPTEPELGLVLPFPVRSTQEEVVAAPQAVSIIPDEEGMAELVQDWMPAIEAKITYTIKEYERRYRVKLNDVAKEDIRNYFYRGFQGHLLDKLGEAYLENMRTEAETDDDDFDGILPMAFGLPMGRPLIGTRMHYDDVTSESIMEELDALETHVLERDPDELQEFLDKEITSARLVATNTSPVTTATPRSRAAFRLVRSTDDVSAASPVVRQVSISTRVLGGSESGPLDVYTFSDKFIGEGFIISYPAIASVTPPAVDSLTYVDNGDSGLVFTDGTKAYKVLYNTSTTREDPSNTQFGDTLLEAIGVPVVHVEGYSKIVFETEFGHPAVDSRIIPGLSYDVVQMNYLDPQVWTTSAFLTPDIKAIADQNLEVIKATLARYGLGYEDGGLQYKTNIITGEVVLVDPAEITVVDPVLFKAFYTSLPLRVLTRDENPNEREARESRENPELEDYNPGGD
ncbi:class I SAM-dependent methyltransferase [bacterium]|nr:class I SAM-dependent methyltransferase [bacterium]